MSFPNYKTVDGVLYHQNDSTAEFKYSDGEEFEVALYNRICAAQDKSLFSPELTTKIFDWPSYCHLSPVRANLLRPVADILKTNVLELGAGCGIITRYLGELGGNVTAVEASALRAKITRARTEDLSNVQVVCDRIELFNHPEKFDSVIMVGVLQYSRLFSSIKENSEIEILKSAISHLHEDGVLIIAIQNKLGLKYFAGCPEANTGIPYFGIENRYNKNSIIRFDLEEIKLILRTLGLTYQKIFFPFPDYHIPCTIFSEKAIHPIPAFSGVVDMIMNSAFRDAKRPDWVVPNFILESAWETVYNAGLAANLSNAFLILASKTHKTLNLLNNNEVAWHFSADRQAAYATGKTFSLDQTNNIKISPCKLTDKVIHDKSVEHVLGEEPYVNGRVYRSLLLDIIKNPKWQVSEVANWALKWMQFICQEAGLSDLYEIDLQNQLISGIFYDCTPFNCILDKEGKLNYIDREWCFTEDIKLCLVFIRGIISSFINVTKFCKSTSPNLTAIILSIFDHLNLPITINDITNILDDDKNCQEIVNHSDGTKSSGTKMLLGLEELYYKLTQVNNLSAQLEERNGVINNHENS